MNLLLVVDAVLQERSATRAAGRLHTTQSAVSNSLRRARQVFGDALVVRTGRGFALTPKGSELAPKLRAILRDVERVVGDARAFEPEETIRRFNIGCSDAIGMIVLPALLRLFECRLPKAELRVVSLDRAMAMGPSDVDALVGVPHVVPPGYDTEILAEDQMVTVVRKDHPRIGTRLSLETYADLPHVELGLFGHPDDRVDRALATHGLSRQIQVIVPHLALIPFLVGSSDRVGTTMASLARIYAAPLQLRLLKPPVELPPLVIRLLWPRRVGQDPGSVAVREMIRRAVREQFSLYETRPRRRGAAPS